MSDPSTAIKRLSIAWQSELEVLDYWGHEDQARTLSRCREELEGRIDGTEVDAERFAPMLEIWESDAAVLATFGHADQAGALRRCVERLRVAMNGDGTRSGLTVVRSASPRASRPDERPAATTATRP